MPISSIPTPSAPGTAGPYSPAVRCGDWVVLAGQVGITANGLPDGFEAQARQVFANISAVLGDCGLSLSDVAKATCFVTDIGEISTLNTVWAESFAGHKPARSTVQVAALPIGAEVEIEVWAYTG